MLKFDQIKNDINLMNDIDWDMTPEMAVTMYLEWGGSWIKGNQRVVKSKNDVSFYFVISHWDDNPTIYLIRRNSEAADEIAKFHMPSDLKQRFLKSVGYNKGVYAVEGEVREWLKSRLSLTEN